MLIVLHSQIRGPKLVFSVAVCLLAMNASVALPQERPDSSQNGHWWLSLSTRERDGFVAGFADCYSFSHRSSFGNRSLQRYRELTDGLYAANRTRRAKPVGEVILQLRHVPTDEPWLHGGETHRGPHSYFDATYWMQIGDGPDKRRGFVEGYLHCLATATGAPSFSRSPQQYQSLITHWYGLDRGVGDDPYEKRVNTAVADVLMQLCDSCRGREER